MTFTSEFWSWTSPSYVATEKPPLVDQSAPDTPHLKLPAQGKSTVVVFLRHCGCPFAEKTFTDMREAAAKHPDIHFIAVSHSDRVSTDAWLEALPEPTKNKIANLEVVVDSERKAYAAWGLGTSSFWHVLGSLGSVSRLGKEDGINVRSTESGSRWQMAGTFAVDQKGIVQFSKPDERADDMPDFDQVLAALGKR